MRINYRLAAVMLLLIAVCSPVALTAPTTAPSGPKIIMIIRHAEKPDETNGEKNPDLSEAGFKRADALAKILPAHFPKPDFLIATKKSKGSNRPVETITPLSKAMHEEIESTYKDEEFARAAHEVLTNPKYAGKTILIAWHHGKIPELAKALGATDAPDKWDSKVFDRVWKITYENGKATLENLPQQALPGDAEK